MATIERTDFTRLAAWLPLGVSAAAIWVSVVMRATSSTDGNTLLFVLAGSFVALAGIFPTASCIMARRKIQRRNRSWTVHESRFLNSRRAVITVQCDSPYRVVDSVLGALENADMNKITSTLTHGGEGIVFTGRKLQSVLHNRQRYRVELMRGHSPQQWNVEIQASEYPPLGPGTGRCLLVIDDVLAHVSALRPRAATAPQNALQPGWYRGKWSEPALIERVLHVGHPKVTGGIPVTAFAPDGTPASADEVEAAATGTGYELIERIAPPAWA